MTNKNNRNDKSNRKKTLKDFILDEDAKISKKALIIWWLGITIWMLDSMVEAWHSSSPCWWEHSSNIWESHHTSAVKHHSYNSY